MKTSLTDSVVLVTGANGGLGREFVRQALVRGSTKVYASARRPGDWSDPRVVPLELDVTNSESIADAARASADVTIVVNNAGIFTATGDSLLTGDVEQTRRIFETNFFGAVAVARAFTPVMEAHGSGAIIDVVSAVSWRAINGAYSASKAAFWSASNSLRVELAEKHIHLLALHMGFVDTPMTHEIGGPKSDAAEVVLAAYDGLEQGALEVLADDVAVTIKAALSSPVEALYSSLTVA